MSEGKHPGGRPRIIPSPEEFDRRVDLYIDSCAKEGQPILLTGMILALGLYSKDGFYGYAEYPEFADSVKRARMLVEMEYEKRLNLATSATGPIFALKNFGWTDKQEIEHSGDPNNPIKTESVLNVSGLSTEALAEIMAAKDAANRK
jgi:hypothetical protein